jgi:hypothetical protein
MSIVSFKEINADLNLSYPVYIHEGIQFMTFIRQE